MENLIDYLNTSDLSFVETAGGFLEMTYAGEHYKRISVYRSFPLSDTDEFICVRDKDNKEIGLIRALSELPADVAALLRKHLDLRYFTPKILTVNQIREQFGFTNWNAETTRGHVEFSVRNEHASFVHLTADRVIVVDTDGNRYEIESLAALPAKELRKAVFL
ncbi:MAG: DUF1854 domain-containing protein [Eubacteriales bacterium]|nr:DUF1854 domain-containing protein [Eubacteriales bacterium]